MAEFLAAGPSPTSSEFPWSRVVAALRPYVVRLSTPGGWGTGFFLTHGSGGLVSGIATAAHVIDHAHLWEDPIRIEHPVSGTSFVIHHGERAIRVDPNTDTAVVIVKKNNVPFPDQPLSLAPRGMHLTVGNEIGWLGFPAIPVANLCFFSGHVSAWSDELAAYLVDGNAINGVSGGPAVAVTGGSLSLVGVVSAYMPNRASGETLPGLALVRGVERFHDEVTAVVSFDQAKSEESPPSPSPSPSPTPPPPESSGSPTRARK